LATASPSLTIAIGLALCLAYPAQVCYAGEASSSSGETALAKEAELRYRQGDYEGAAKIFAALSVGHSANPLYVRNLGACFYRMRRPEPAISNLRDYLTRAKDIAIEDRSEVQSWIAEMETLRARIDPTSPGPKEVAAPLPPERTPEQAPVDSVATPMAGLAPPEPTPIMPPAEKSRELPPGGAGTPNSVEQASAANPTAPSSGAAALATAATVSDAQEVQAPPRRNKWRIAGIASAGVGVASLATGTILGIVARSRNQSALDQCPKAPCSDEANTLESQAKDYARWANVAFVAGGALALSGVVLYLLAPADKPAAQTQARLSLLVEPTSLGLVTRGTW
jgi:hypothetical protein